MPLRETMTYNQTNLIAERIRQNNLKKQKIIQQTFILSICSFNYRRNFQVEKPNLLHQQTSHNMAMSYVKLLHKG